MEVKNYAFNLINGTYTPLAGVKTVFQMGVQLNTDAFSNEVTLPFNFSVSGDSYNAIRIYNNGFITFGKGLNNGTTMRASIKTPISNTVEGWANDYIVSAFGTNVVAAATGNPEISYGVNTTGDFVVQFQDVAVSGFTSTRATAQIVLKADGTTIQMVYGAGNTGQANVVSPQVGLRGKAVLVDTGDAVGTKVYTYPDWQNRKVPKNSNANILAINSNSPNNSKGDISSSTVSWSDAPTVLPASGLTFQYTP